MLIYFLFSLSGVIAQINLGYKPNRPFYAGNPANTPKPIIKPGTPWPAKPEDYRNATSQLPLLENKIKEEETTEGFVWESSTQRNEDETSTILNSTEYAESETTPASGGSKMEENNVNMTKIEDCLEQISSPTDSENSSLFINLLQQLIDKRKPWPNKPESTTGFIWETETSSAKKGLLYTSKPLQKNPMESSK